MISQLTKHIGLDFYVNKWVDLGQPLTTLFKIERTCTKKDPYNNYRLSKLLVVSLTTYRMQINMGSRLKRVTCH